MGNDSCRLRNLNTWFSLVALLKRVQEVKLCWRKYVARDGLSKCMISPHFQPALSPFDFWLNICSLGFGFLHLLPCLIDSMPPRCDYYYPSRSISPNKLFQKSRLIMVFYHSVKREVRHVRSKSDCKWYKKIC